MEEQEKISVIVPVYNVEPYLKKCLDSLCNQTYHNLEIILVDDGSFDNSKNICEEYKRMDDRVLVIHQKHGGVSAARNAGLKLATGFYIGFVDSDDWIETEMFECMLNAIKSNEADVSVCGRWEEKENETICKGWQTRQIMMPEEAVAALLDDEDMKGYLWDKLYRRSLFDGISFPMERTFEDTSVQDMLLCRAERIVCVPDILYHYRKHKGSVIDDTSLRNRFFWYVSLRERHERIKNLFPNLVSVSAAQCLIAAATIWSAYYTVSSSERKEYQLQMNEIAVFSKECSKSYFREMKISRAIKLIVSLLPYPTWWSYTLARLIGCLYIMKNKEPI